MGSDEGHIKNLSAVDQHHAHHELVTHKWRVDSKGDVYVCSRLHIKKQVGVGTKTKKLHWCSDVCLVYKILETKKLEQDTLSHHGSACLRVQAFSPVDMSLEQKQSKIDAK